MDSKFSAALDIIKSVKDLEGQRFQINKHQCQRLASLYGRVGQFFEHFQKVNRDFNGNLSLPSLDVTESVLRKGHLLVAKYTKEDWFESLVTAGVNQDSFEAIHVELEACIRLIYERVETGFVASTATLKPRPLIMQLAEVLPLLYLDESDRASLFERDAEMDKKDMLAKIDAKKATVSESKNLTDEQRTQAIHSLDMATEKLSNLVNDIQLQAATTEDLPSYLRIKSSEIELLRLIGTGGSGEVHECRWMHLKYAVKILQTNDVVGLRKEVENLIPLRHPNIVLLVGFSVAQDTNCPMIVMELLDQDLHTLLNQRTKGKPFPISTAVDFIYQIATGMAYLHRQMIFHGDLKALNVLIRHHKGEYELKISDFGVSEHARITKPDNIATNDFNFVDNDSFNTVNVGTTRWRAPEVFDATNGDPRRYSLKADVYSFAMTCVEILTGNVPYAGISTRDIKKHIQAGERPQLPSTVPEDLRNLIAQCWRRAPTSRPDFPQICTEMQRLKEFHSPSTILCGYCNIL